jgi:deoxycytidine triphosphate deaminase
MTEDTKHQLYSEPVWKTQDPDFNNPDRKGMLLSDQINKFCNVKLLIAENYSSDRLRPAAYTLTIGDDYVDSSGRKKKLTSKKPSYEMPPNSIVFVSIKEMLDLPYYIAARFNLRVDWVYKGILLGTGPQVEPGFRGYLSCPLYNLTDRSHTITRGEEFATIDFERTTSFVDKTPSEIAPNLRANRKLEEYVDGNRKFVLFKQDTMQPLAKYSPDFRIVSSLVEMSREVRTWRNIGIAFAVSFLALTLTLLGLQNNLLRETITNAKDIAGLKQQLDKVTQQLQEEKAHQVKEDSDSKK